MPKDQTERFTSREALLERILEIPPDAVLVDYSSMDADSCHCLQSTAALRNIPIALAVSPEELPRLQEILASLPGELLLKTEQFDILLKIFLEKQRHKLSERTTYFNLNCKELINSDVFFKSLFLNFDDTVLILDGYNIIDCNEAAVNLFFYASKKELLSSPLTDLLPRIQESGKSSGTFLSDMMIAANDIGNARSEGILWTTQKKRICADLSMMRIPVPEQHLYILVIRDISDRKRAEESLRHSKQKYQSVVEQLQEGVFVFKEDKIIYTNKAFDKMLGYPADNIGGFTLKDIMHEQDYEIVKERYLHRFEEGKISQEFECRLMKSNGLDIISVNMTLGRLVYDGESAAIGTIKDITLQKLAENALRASESKYRKIFELSPEIITLIDSKGVISDINSQIYEWLKIKKEDILGKSIYSLPVFDMRTKARIRITLMKRRKNFTIAPMELEFIDAEGNIKHGHLITTAIRNRDGDIIQDLVMISDITQRKITEKKIKNLNAELEKRVIERTAQLEKALHELKAEITVRKNTESDLLAAQKELHNALQAEKELSELKSRFISMISHEYRTPLTVIMTSTFIIEQLYQGVRKDDFVSFINKIRHSVSTMTSLLENVLDIGKSDAGMLRVKKADYEIIALARDIIDEVKIIDEDKHMIELLCSSKTLTVSTDEGLLRQILVNLLVNAGKFSPHFTLILLEIKYKDRQLTITVSDNGIGIPEKDMKKIFDSFHRGTNIGTIGGTGLGLTIVQRCVKALNGTVDVKSKIDKGTTFLITLPLD